MATTIKLKNSVTTTNAPSSLAQGEVAINITDKKVWVGNAATTPIQLLGDGGSVNFTTVDTTNLQVTNIKAKDGTASASIANSTGAFTVAAAFAANGGATLGDASGDALTINSSAVSIPNGLNFTGGAVTLATALNVASGGTGLTSLTANRIPYGNGTSAFNSSSFLTYDGTNLDNGATASARTRISRSGFINFVNTTNTSGFDIGLLGGGSDLNVYVYQRANGFMAFGTNNTERMRIDSSGSVSIGATSGNGRLNVVVPSAASSGQTPFFVSDGTQASFSIQLGTELVRFTTGTSDALTIETNSAERMRITSGGQVGIGVTPAAWDSFTPLQINANGTIAANNFGGGNTQFFVANGIYYGGGGYKYLITGTGVGRYAINGEYHYWFGAGSGTAGNAITETQIMQVSANSTLTLQGGTSSGGTGIAFPAIQSASSNANTLDDYEEGTWTPVLQGSSTAGTYTYDTARTGGNYTKIGNTVYIRGVIRVASTTSAGSGSAQITGLPFPTINPDTSWGRLPGSLALQGGPTLANSSIFVTTEGASSTYLTFGIQGTATWTAATVAEVATTDAIWFFEIQYNVS